MNKYKCPKCNEKTDKFYNIGLFEWSTEETFSACEKCRKNFKDALLIFEEWVGLRRNKNIIDENKTI